MSATSSASEFRDGVLPDVLAPGLRLVFCGTAPSRRSAADRAYYAKPGNKFWPTLHRIGLTPRQLAPHEYAELLEYGIGLTDLSKTRFGQDDELEFSEADRRRLARTILRARPRALAFTSKNAAEKFFGRKLAFGRQPVALVQAALAGWQSTGGIAEAPRIDGSDASRSSTPLSQAAARGLDASAAFVDLLEIFVLPSTSGLACRSWDERPWRELAKFVGS